MPASSLLHAAVIAASLVAAAPSAASAPQGEADQGVLAGTVVSADAGRPIRQARVTASSATARVVRSVHTDDRGTFRITGLPPGEYTLSAAKDGYVESIYGQRMPGSGRAGTPIRLPARQEVTRISLPLSRGGVLTGTVVDEAGEPALGVPVRAFRWVWRSGERTLQPAGRALTDDRGVYRIPTLPQGEYVVSVTPAGIDVADFAMEGMAYTEVVEGLQRAGTGNVEFRGARFHAGDFGDPPTTPTTGFATLYYPGSTQASAAASVPVTVAEESRGIDFRLQIVPMARLAGSAIGHDGPAPGATVQLFDHAQVTGIGVRTTRTGPDGRFSFAGVPPGQYTLIARSTPRGARPLEASPREAAEFLAAAPNDARAATIAAALAGAAQWWASADVTADGRDRLDVQLALQPGLSISGRVAFEGGSGPPPNFTRMSLTVTPLGPQRTTGDVMLPPPAAVDAAGRFTIRGVMPGRYTIAVAAGAPAGYTMRSAVFGGQDVLDVPFELTGQDQPSGGVVTFTTRISELGGMVLDGSDQAATGVTVIAFAVDERFWTPASRRIRAVRPASDGRYVLANLPPGDYRLVAVADVEPGQWFDPAYLRRLGGSVTVTVIDGGTHTHEVRVK